MTECIGRVRNVSRGLIISVFLHTKQTNKMPPKRDWARINRVNENNARLNQNLQRLAELEAEEEDGIPARRVPNPEQRALEPVRRGAPVNIPPRKQPPRAPAPPAQGNFDMYDEEEEDDDEEEDDGEGVENMAMMMRPPVPRPQERAGRGRGIQNLPVRRPANQRRQNEPMGAIRYANGQLRAAVSWVFTIRLTNNPQRVNYFPYQQDPREIQMLNGRYVRPYVIPTLAQLANRRNAPIFLLYQLEMGNNGVLGHDGLPLHENLHYQGFMEFAGKVTAVDICTVMGWLVANGWNMGDVWLEPRQGRKQDAINYVTKDETAFAVHPIVADYAVGDMNEQEFTDAINDMRDGEDGPLYYFRREEGEQRPPDAADLAGIVTNMIKEGATYHDILMAYPNYAMQRTYGINAAIDAIGEKKGGKLQYRDVKTFVFWGDSRTGKSRKIAEMEGDADLAMDLAKVYVKNRKEDYYQHYTDQEVLVLDEFVGASNGARMSIDDLLMMLDGQNLSLAVKHKSPRFAKWKRVYITSNIPPRLWFPNAVPSQLEALYRRLETGGITKFIDLDKPASVEAHEAEVISQTYLRDRPNVILRSSTWT